MTAKDGRTTAAAAVAVKDKTAAASKQSSSGDTVGASKKGKPKQSRKWSASEIDALLKAVAALGSSDDINWVDVAKSVPTRSGKQCREKWRNDLRPDISKDPWSSREEYIVCRVHCQVGNQWADIARFLPGRAENSIKNHYNATLRSKAEAKPPSLLWVYGKQVLANDGCTSLELFDRALKIYAGLPNVEPLEGFAIGDETLDVGSGGGGGGGSGGRGPGGALRPVARGGSLAGGGGRRPRKKHRRWGSGSSDETESGDELMSSVSDSTDTEEGRTAHRGSVSARGVSAAAALGMAAPYLPAPEEAAGPLAPAVPASPAAGTPPLGGFPAASPAPTPSGRHHVCVVRHGPAGRSPMAAARRAAATAAVTMAAAVPADPFIGAWDVGGGLSPGGFGSHASLGVDWLKTEGGELSPTALGFHMSPRDAAGAAGDFFGPAPDALRVRAGSPTAASPPATAGSVGAGRGAAAGGMSRASSGLHRSRSTSKPGTLAKPGPTLGVVVYSPTGRTSPPPPPVVVMSESDVFCTPSYHPALDGSSPHPLLGPVAPQQLQQQQLEQLEHDGPTFAGQLPHLSPRGFGPVLRGGAGSSSAQRALNHPQAQESKARPLQSLGAAPARTASPPSTMTMEDTLMAAASLGLDNFVSDLGDLSDLGNIGDGGGACSGGNLTDRGAAGGATGGRVAAGASTLSLSSSDDAACGALGAGAVTSAKACAAAGAAASCVSPPLLSPTERWHRSVFDEMGDGSELAELLADIHCDGAAAAAALSIRPSSGGGSEAAALAEAVGSGDGCGHDHSDAPRLHDQLRLRTGALPGVLAAALNPLGLAMPAACGVAAGGPSAAPQQLHGSLEGPGAGAGATPGLSHMPLPLQALQLQLQQLQQLQQLHLRLQQQHQLQGQQQAGGSGHVTSGAGAHATSACNGGLAPSATAPEVSAGAAVPGVGGACASGPASHRTRSSAVPLSSGAHGVSASGGFGAQAQPAPLPLLPQAASAMLMAAAAAAALQQQAHPLAAPQSQCTAALKSSVLKARAAAAAAAANCLQQQQPGTLLGLGGPLSLAASAVAAAAAAAAATAPPPTRMIPIDQGGVALPPSLMQQQRNHA
ncbi:hypothetical protein HXX76_004207 [Chlamydomonas incerta]|uniref:Uncharacterized protein n=1 Tax=Chlamydomonas incerta TaxID=51695 RepID=A0A835T7E1_CHLIN|nr:hypothetical protein HXX76_004207 [Chlamydomonas incerta]|eukprot:KAG2440093.1 hypothetical protein HXX76_004207 [Chlamydomonas incerta]